MRCCSGVTALAGRRRGARRYSLHFEDEGQNSRRDGGGAGRSLEVLHAAVTAAGDRDLERRRALVRCEGRAPCRGRKQTRNKRYSEAKQTDSLASAAPEQPLLFSTFHFCLPPINTLASSSGFLSHLIGALPPINTRLPACACVCPVVT